MRTAGRHAGGALLFLAALVLALLVGEAASRWLLPRPGFVPAHGSWLPGAVRSHPTRGYELTPGFAATVRAEDTFGSMRIEVNELGLRERPLAVLRARPVDVLAVGDSFTFGFGMAREQAWPARLEQELPAPAVVLNAGIPGFNVAQMADMSRDMGQRFAPPLVVAAVFTGGFDRLADPLTAFGGMVLRTSETRVVRVVEGGLVRSPMYQPWLVDADLWLKTRWFMAAHVLGLAYRGVDALRSPAAVPDGRPRAPAAPSEATLRRAEAWLGETAADADRAGRGFVLMIVVPFDAAGRPDPGGETTAAALLSWCADHAVRCIDPSPVLRIAGQSGTPLRVRPTDYHWSPDANRIAARELADYLRRERLLPRATGIL